MPVAIQYIGWSRWTAVVQFISLIPKVIHMHCTLIPWVEGSLTSTGQRHERHLIC